MKRFSSSLLTVVGVLSLFFIIISTQTCEAEVRQEVLSPKGDLLVRVLMNDDGEGEIWVMNIATRSTVKIGDYARSAEVVISPDQKWIAVNIHPASSGGNTIDFYRQTTGINYELVEALVPLINEQFEGEVARQNGKPADASLEEFGFNAMGWDSTGQYCLVQMSELKYEGGELQDPVMDFVLDVKEGKFLDSKSEKAKSLTKTILKSVQVGE